MRVGQKILYTWKENSECILSVPYCKTINFNGMHVFYEKVYKKVYKKVVLSCSRKYESSVLEF